MLRYLTHKLRTQSLNETEAYHVKTDDDRDSGTESDDEGAEIEELQKYMESIISLDSSRHSDHHRRSKRQQQHQPPQVTADDDGATPTTDGPPSSSRPPHRHHHHHHRRRTSHHRSSPALADSALPSDSDHNIDHHSSEEELEVINSGSPTHRLHHQPEKRKWDCGSSDALVMPGDDDLQPPGDENCPVEFRTSPPADAHKPSKCLRQAHIPAHELCSVSPRKRHRRTPTGHAIQRPSLDFEKMQQINRVRLL